MKVVRGGESISENWLEIVKDVSFGSVRLEMRERNRYVGEEEITRSNKALKKWKSLGCMDGMVKSGGEVGMEWICKVYTEAWKASQVPDD